MGPDGYLTAAAQSALLEAYAGTTAAAADRTLADDARRPRGADIAGERSPASRRGRRRAGRRHNPNAPRGDDSEEGGVPHCPAEAEPPSTAACASMPCISETSWAALDAVDLAEELRCPVPTMQDVPPFMRSAVRTALVTALSRLRDSADASQGGLG